MTGITETLVMMSLGFFVVCNTQKKVLSTNVHL